MRTVIAQKVDVVQLVEPIRIIHHHGVGRPIAKRHVFIKDAKDALLVGFDPRDVQHLTRLVLAGGIADFRRAPAHQDNRLMTGLLQPAQHHDLQ